MPSLEALEAQVTQHSKQLDTLSSDVRDLRNNSSQASLDQVRIQASLSGLIRDVQQMSVDFRQSQKDLMDDQETRRNMEFQELRETLRGRTITFRERVMYIFIPVLVALIGAGVLIWSVTAK